MLCVRYLSVLDVDVFILLNLTFLVFPTSGRHLWSTKRISISSNNNNKKKQNKFINMVWFLYA